jgi:hypothetical protein
MRRVVPMFLAVRDGTPFWIQGVTLYRWTSAGGNLYLSDVDHRQIKRIPADKL